MVITRLSINIFIFNFIKKLYRRKKYLKTYIDNSKYLIIN